MIPGVTVLGLLDAFQAVRSRQLLVGHRPLVCRVSGVRLVLWIVV